MKKLILSLALTVSMYGGTISATCFNVDPPFTLNLVEPCTPNFVEFGELPWGDLGWSFRVGVEGPNGRVGEAGREWVQITYQNSGSKSFVLTGGTGIGYALGEIADCPAQQSGPRAPNLPGDAGHISDNFGQLGFSISCIGNQPEFVPVEFGKVFTFTYDVSIVVAGWQWIEYADYRALDLIDAVVDADGNEIEGARWVEVPQIVVPEPKTASMYIVGLMPLTWFALRRRRAQIQVGSCEQESD